MIRRNKKQIFVMAVAVFIIYNISQIAFFHDREFERAVRDTLYKYDMSFSDKREQAIRGIIWKKDLKEVRFISIDFKEYNIKDISDLKYFKNMEILMLVYPRSHESDTDIYKDEHILDNLYKIKDLKHLDRIHIIHLKVNDDIEAMFPNAKVFIY